MVLDKPRNQQLQAPAATAAKQNQQQLNLRPTYGAGIDDEEYFHGFIEKEDVNGMLERPGEFLVRICENEKGQRVMVLSVRRSATSDINDDEAVKHFMIQQESCTIKKQPAMKFRIEKKWFPNVQQLIQYHVSSRQPVSSTIPDAILVQGVFRQQWEVSHDDLQTVLKIGEGTFGEVYFGYMRIAGKKKRQCVIKIAKNQGNSKANVKEIMKEARVMRNFDHPHVVRMFGVAVEREPLALVMEFVDGGSLEKYLRTTVVISCAEREKMCCDAAWGKALLSFWIWHNVLDSCVLGLEYLHECHFLHRDIAARNCLYSKLKILKIADFGLSREGHEYHLKSPTKLPLKWLSPETIETGIHTQKSDVFSFGILVWEIFSNAATPYANIPANQTTQAILEGARPLFPDCTPSGIKELITKSCWSSQPINRLNMQEISVELEQITKIAPPYFQYKLRENAVPPVGPAPQASPGPPEEENLDGSEKKHKKESKELFTQCSPVTKKLGPTKMAKVAKEPSLDGSAKKLKKKKDSNDLDTSGKKIRRRSAPSPTINHKDESVRDDLSAKNTAAPGADGKRGCRRRKTGVTNNEVSKVMPPTKVHSPHFDNFSSPK